MSDTGRYAFSTPSGAIVCRGDKDALRCGATDRQWEPPGQKGCQDPNGDLTLDARGRAAVVCHGDPVTQRADKDVPSMVLGYGQALRAGDILCLSQSNGLSCSSGTTGSSIFLSTDRYEVNDR